MGGFSRDPGELKVPRGVLRTVMVLTWILGFALLGSVGAIAAAATFLLFPKAT